MLIVQSYDSYAFFQPRPVRVRKVLPSAGWRRRQWAVVDVPMEENSSPVPFAMARRAGHKWRTPRAGRSFEMLAYDVGEDAIRRMVETGEFVQPTTGAVVCYLFNDDLEARTADWARDRNGQMQQGGYVPPVRDFGRGFR